eukprot:scaffold293551_cov31-Tisochrysis_lutea.AAC.2
MISCKRIPRLSSCCWARSHNWWAGMSNTLSGHFSTGGMYGGLMPPWIHRRLSSCSVGTVYLTSSVQGLIIVLPSRPQPGNVQHATRRERARCGLYAWGSSISGSGAGRAEYGLVCGLAPK